MWEECPISASAMSVRLAFLVDGPSSVIRIGPSKNKKTLTACRKSFDVDFVLYFGGGDGDGVLVSEWDRVNCLGVQTGEREGNVVGRGLLWCWLGVFFGCWGGRIIWAGRWSGGSMFCSGCWGFCYGRWGGMFLCWSLDC